MFSAALSRTTALATAATLCALLTAPVHAQSTSDNPLGLNLSTTLRDRMFWNLHVISTKTKTTSEHPVDVTPKIVATADLSAMRADLISKLPAGVNLNTYTASQLPTSQDKLNWYKQKYYGTALQSSFTGIYLLDQALVTDYGFAPGEGYLTTPKGILAKSGDPSETVALSVGYFLNDGYNWAVEALLLGAPLRVSVYGAGVNEIGDPNQLAGREIIRTKMLPPLAKFGYYFGDRSWPVRPYVGVAAMYAIFFDTKSTDFFNEYQGGKTTVSLKNAFGVGPFAGLQSDVGQSGWQIGLSIGKIRLKTQATLVTRGTMFRTGSPALLDYTQTVQDAITQAEGLGKTANTNASAAGVTPFPNGFTTELMKDLAAYKQAKQGGDGTLGTFVRKQNSTLDNTIFMLSIGRSF